jgi:predicted RNA-binding Zn ribbon-like protein
MIGRATVMFTPQPVHHVDTPVAFHFIAGSISLDFANTGGVFEEAPVDDFQVPADLTRWFAESALALADLSVQANEFTAAREVRNAIWRAAVRLSQRDRPDRADLAIINSAAIAPSRAPQIDTVTGGARWHQSPTPSAALATIARDAIELFTSDHAGRIRQCANPRCILLFVDTSRPGKRRWCSMDRCGNLDKTRRYRRRATSTPG